MTASKIAKVSSHYCSRHIDRHRRICHILFVQANKSGFGGLEVACWPLVPEWSRGSVLAFGTQVV